MSVRVWDRGLEEASGLARVHDLQEHMSEEDTDAPWPMGPRGARRS